MFPSLCSPPEQNCQEVLFSILEATSPLDSLTALFLDPTLFLITASYLLFNLQLDRSFKLTESNLLGAMIWACWTPVPPFFWAKTPNWSRNSHRTKGFPGCETFTANQEELVTLCEPKQNSCEASGSHPWSHFTLKQSREVAKQGTYVLQIPICAMQGGRSRRYSRFTETHKLLQWVWGGQSVYSTTQWYIPLAPRAGAASCDQ